MRPDVIRGVKWAEFEGIDWASPAPDAEAPRWRIPAERMKLTLDRKEDKAFDHLVPLSRQAVETLLAIRSVIGRLSYVFPSTRHLHRPLSENALGYPYNCSGYHGRHVPHGGYAVVWIGGLPLQSSDDPANKVEGAYNRAAYMERRREIAQEWADLWVERLVCPYELLGAPRR